MIHLLLISQKIQHLKTLVLDNYDSFTYNLVHYLEAEGADVFVARNNEMDLADVEMFDQIVLSPGPSLPKDAGIMPQLIERYIEKKKFLGVCLGMQAIVQYFGGVLYNLEEVKHGIQEEIMRCESSDHDIFYQGFQPKFKVGLYHSWGVRIHDLPKPLTCTALWGETVMSIAHPDLPVWGVQYHPESVLTENGKKMIRNWLDA